MTIKRLIRWAALALGIGLFVIQLLPYGRDHTNPPVQIEPNWDSAATRALAAAACDDCHSNHTQWPWYSNIAPLSWLVQRDVEEGRRALNYSKGGRGEGGGDSAEKVQNGEMPPFYYQVTHPAARLSDADRAALVRGLVATFGGEGGGGGD